jgi:hypothetical protein
MQHQPKVPQTSDDYQRFLRKLFNPGELVCATDTMYGTSLQLVDEVIEESATPPPQFIAINPLHTKRADANVTAHRNLLFEFDKGAIEEQLANIANMNVPYTSLVYSGGKSVHAIIALTEGLSRPEYDEIWDLCKTVLWTADPTSKNPSRLTRVAGAVRDNGTTQELVDLRNRVSKDRVIKWLGRFSAHIERSQEQRRLEIERREQARLQRASSGVSGLAAVDEFTIKFLKGDIQTKNSRHGRLVAACYELLECGVDYDEALTLIEQAADLHGITADPKRLREGEQIVNYVYGFKRSRMKR